MNKNLSALSSDGATLAKCIATFGIVLTHAHKVFGYLGIGDSQVFYLRGLHAWGTSGVPVFFLLSGYFLTVKGSFDYQLNLKKKLRSLVIPYCAFMLFYALISCVGARVLPSFFDDFTKFSARDWFMHLFGIPFVVGPEFYGPFWFLRELFILNVLAFALVPASKKIPGYILIPAMTILFFLPVRRMLRYSVPFFLTGMYFGNRKSIPILNNPLHLSALALVTLAIPTFIMGNESRHVSIFLATIATLMIAGKLSEREDMRSFGKKAIPFSFPIYAMHEYPMVTTMRLLALRHISVPTAVAAFFIVPLLVIFACVCVTIVWRRLSPKSFMLFTGGRY